MGIYNFLRRPGKNERLSYSDRPVEVNEHHDANRLLEYPWVPFSAPLQHWIQIGFPMSEIPDFTDSELWTVRATLQERYGKPVEPEPADCELNLDQDSRELTRCPSLYWRENDCNFVTFKLGEGRYRCQFFYEIHEMFGTGIEEFDNIGDCVLTLLRIQADHDAERQGKFPSRA